MSVTGHNKNARQVDDFYETPAWCVQSLLAELQRRKKIKPGSRIVDPGVGIGAIAAELLCIPNVDVYGIETDAGRVDKATARFAGNKRAHILQANFIHWAAGVVGTEKHQGFDLVIGNPPFSLAMDFVVAARAISPRVAMLLRLPWLASRARANFLRAHTPSVCVLPKRPSFVMNVRCGEKSNKCGYEEVWAVGTAKPRKCPGCGGDVSVVDTDATDYGWMIWDENPPTVHILEVPHPPR